LYVLPGNNPGLLVPGNINLLARPKVHYHGSIATVRSITIGPEDGGTFILLPTVIYWSSAWRVVPDSVAEQHFQRTHHHLGIFSSNANAESYAKRLHRQQAAYYHV
jgi:hypothetical protein